MVVNAQRFHSGQWMGWYGLSVDTRSSKAMASEASATKARSASVFGFGSKLIDFSGPPTLGMSSEVDDIKTRSAKRLGMEVGGYSGGINAKERAILIFATRVSFLQRGCRRTAVFGHTTSQSVTRARGQHFLLPNQSHRRLRPSAPVFRPPATTSIRA